MMNKIFGEPKPIKKSAEKAEQEIIAELETQRYPFDSEFRSFVKLSKELEAGKEVVDGKPREYVSTFSPIPRYQEAFGNGALAESTINYRIGKIKPDDYPEDFLVLENDTKTRYAKYFINRLNTELMKKLFMPTLMDEELEKVIEKVGELEEFNTSMNDLEFETKLPRKMNKDSSPIEDEEYHDENEYLKTEREDD